MADNRHLYGFRWAGNLEGGCCPKALDFLVASGQTFSAGGTVDLNIGDPVSLVAADGTVTLSTLGADAASGVIFGVVTEILNARVDANGYSRPASFLPNGTTYATEPLRSRVGVIPFGRNLWEIDCNNTTNTTINAYRALIGANANAVFSRDITNPNRPKANPLLDMTTVTTTNTHDFRIVGVSNTADNFDFTGNFVKLRVVANNTSEAPWNRLGV